MSSWWISLVLSKYALLMASIVDCGSGNGPLLNGSTCFQRGAWRSIWACKYLSYDGVHAVYEDEIIRCQTEMLQRTDMYVEPTWALIDPALHHVRDEYRYHQKHPIPATYESFAFYLPPSGPEQLISQTSEQIANYGHTPGWRPAFEMYRNYQYPPIVASSGASPPEFSGEHIYKSEDRSCSVVYSSSPVSEIQIQNLAPSAIESPFDSQASWCTAQHLTPPPMQSSVQLAGRDSFAMQELEFRSSLDVGLEQTLRGEDDMARVKLLIHTPEELDLSESVATSTISSRTNTFSTGSSEVYESANSEVDNDSDPDFDPRHTYTAGSIACPTHSRSHPTSYPRSSKRSSQAHSVTDVNARIHKPSRHSRVGSGSSSKEKARYRTFLQPAAVKAIKASPAKSGSKMPKSFPCTFHKFGCNSTFGNKNEWKRHVASQHLQLGFFRCDLGTCHPDNNERPCNESRHKRKSSTAATDEERELIFNDFNRKDLFTQHCRRMHGPHRHTSDNTTVTNQMINARRPSTGGLKSKVMKQTITKEDEAAFEVELEDIRRRCWYIRRKAPLRTGCGFCGRVFQVDTPTTPTRAKHDEARDDEGKAEEKVWEERMEHIGRHYERDGCSPDAELVDDDLVDWGLQVGVLERVSDDQGRQREWLTGYEMRPNEVTIKSEARSPISPRRNGLRRRDRRVSETIAVATTVVKKEEQDFDSEDDASAEDE